MPDADLVGCVRVCAWGWVGGVCTGMCVEAYMEARGGHQVPCFITLSSSLSLGLQRTIVMPRFLTWALGIQTQFLTASAFLLSPSLVSS